MQVFYTSMQKSGTHIVWQLLGAMNVDTSEAINSRFRYRNGHPDPEILNTLHQLPYMATHAHLIHHPVYESVLRDKREGVRTLFSYRDPRDVIISFVHWNARGAGKGNGWKRKSVEYVHEHIESEWFESGRIDWFFHDFYPWMESDIVCKLRYEDLRTQPDVEARKIYDFVGNPILQGHTHMARRIKPQDSVTFRGGRIGDWKAYITGDLKDRIYDRIGDMIEAYGYEL